MTIAFVQAAPPAGALTTNVTSITATLGVASTAGNILLAAVMHSASAQTITAPANWVQLAANSATRTLQIWAYVNNPGGITSVQFSAGTSGGMSLIVVEFSGVATSSPLDQNATNVNSVGSVTMDSGTTATTTNANELWFAALGYGGGSNRTISGITNGFTADQIANASSGGGTGAHLSDYYKIVAATGTANVEATLASSSSWAGAIVTLLPAAISATASSVGGTGGESAQGQLTGLANVDGSGGISSQAQTQGAANGGGSGGAVSSAQLQGTLNAGGSGGISIRGVLLPIIAIGGAGGVNGTGQLTVQAHYGIAVMSDAAVALARVSDASKAQATLSDAAVAVATVSDRLENA